MAIIYTYPTKATLATSDLILISDSADGNKTKNATVTSIKDAIDVVDSITATSPLVASASTGAVTLSIPAATSGVNGYLASTDWSTFNGKQVELQSGVNIKTINSNSILGSGDLVISGAAANPAGANTQLQYNNNGSFGANDLLSYNNQTLYIGKAAASTASHLKVYGGGSDDAKLTLYCSAGTHGVTIDGPDHTGGTPASYTVKLPNSLPNVNNQILESNASGTLSWIPTPAGGSGGPGTGTQYSLPIWSTTSTLGDSLITQNSGATVVNIGTSIASFSTVAGTGSVFATRLAVNGYSTFGGKLQLNSADGGTSVTLQGPPNSGTTYDLQLPNAVGTANQVLKLPATPGSTNQLVWGDATGGSTYTLQAEAKSGTSVPLKLDASSGTDSTVNLKEGTNITLTRNSSSEITIASTSGGISPFPIYQAKDSVAVGAQTIIRQSVCETAGTYSKLEYFSIGATSYPVYFAIYAGTITAAGSAVKRLEGFNSTQAAGINVINFTGSYNFTAGQDIVIVVSANDTVGLAGSNTLLNHVDISRGSAVYTSSFPSSLSSLLDSIPNSVATGVCTHIY